MTLTASQKESVEKVFRHDTSLPSISLTAKRQNCGVYDSKLGGLPYLPQGFRYPCASGSGQPLRLLAQMNFEDLPPLPRFPQRGILQFYIAQTDMYGADLNNGLNQNEFRVIYHRDIVRDESLLNKQIPTFDNESELDFPFEGEFRLFGELKSCPMSPWDFRFDDTMLELCRRFVDTDAEEVYEFDSEWYNALVDEVGTTGHRIGGYPFFTQTDPRSEERYNNHTVLLLQIDSDGRDEDEILWGDCGVANFFIEPQALEKCDFSNVLYNWDCG